MNNRNDVSDLLAEANIGANSKRIVCCGELTLNTPYKAGLVPGSQGIAYINMASENYGTIMYITSGGNDVFLRKKSSGTWDTNWTKLITNADLDERINFGKSSTAIQTPYVGNTAYRLQININNAANVGLVVYKTTNGGDSWESFQTII